MKKVFTSHNSEDARMAKLLLDEHDIDARVTNEHTATVFGSPEPAVKRPKTLPVFASDGIEFGAVLYTGGWPGAAAAPADDRIGALKMSLQVDGPCGKRIGFFGFIWPAPSRSRLCSFVSISLNSYFLRGVRWMFRRRKMNCSGFYRTESG